MKEYTICNYPIRPLCCYWFVLLQAEHSARDESELNCKPHPAAGFFLRKSSFLVTLLAQRKENALVLSGAPNSPCAAPQHANPMKCHDKDIFLQENLREEKSQVLLQCCEVQRCGDTGHEKLLYLTRKQIMHPGWGMLSSVKGMSAQIKRFCPNTKSKKSPPPSTTLQHLWSRCSGMVEPYTLLVI